MVNAFRYVLDDNLYTAFAQFLRLENGRKVYGIICPDFNDKGFEVIETGIHRARYQPAESNYLNPFSQILIQWFSDYKLLSE